MYNACIVHHNYGGWISFFLLLSISLSLYDLILLNLCNFFLQSNDTHTHILMNLLRIVDIRFAFVVTKINVGFILRVLECE